MEQGIVSNFDTDVSVSMQCNLLRPPEMFEDFQFRYMKKKETKRCLFNYVLFTVNIDVSIMCSKLGVHLDIKLFSLSMYGNCSVIV